MRPNPTSAPAPLHPRPTLIEIRPLVEPRHRNWERLRGRFAADREGLRVHDPQGCSALELEEAMDSFLAWPPPQS